MTDTLKIAVDDKGVALVEIEVPGQSMNVVNEAFLNDLEAFVKRLADDDAIKGAIITSARDAFMAGADLNMLGGIAASRGAVPTAEIFEAVFRYSGILRAMETSGKPVVAAVGGLAMGGGLELALACHHRIVADDPAIRLSFPEVMVGLLPGAGGTQRMPRLSGIQAALQYLSTGRALKPNEAVGLGLFQEVAPKAEIVDRARAWLADKPTAEQPWDKKGFKFPGGAGAMNPNSVQIFMAASAMAQEKTLHNYPAVEYILSAVFEGSIVPFDTAIKVESKYFTRLVTGSIAPNMIRTLFVNKQKAEKGAKRPPEEPPYEIKRLGMLGAGMMGAGIAYVSAKAGMEVVLLDTALENAARGKAYSEKLVEKLTRRGKMSKEDGEALLARIRPTADVGDLADVDLVIEAVFEDRKVKREITQKVEAVIRDDVVFASNTSTLPITGLAENFSRANDFIGIHFFSPVEKMPLVEIIMGKETGDKALAAALDYVRKIKKTPIVVNDSRGFYTSRCFGTYVTEGAALLKEGVNPALIENAGRMAGMPVGPLAVADEVSIELSYKVLKAAQADMGDDYPDHPADEVITRFVEDLGRLGRKNGKGFYDYPEDGKKHLWPGLAEQFPLADEQPDVEEIKERLLVRQAIEAVRCYDEGVLTDPESGDIGAIFGWGFAPYTGGPFSMIDTIGAKAFVKTCERLKKAHGPRFAPPDLLIRMAEKGALFYDETEARAA